MKQNRASFSIKDLDRHCFVFISEHALHDNRLHRQKENGPLVSRQEQRALLVLRKNVCQLVVNRSLCFSNGLNEISLARASRKNIPEHGLAWRGFTKTIRRRSTGQQPGKSARGPADKPRINRRWTGCQPMILFRHSVYIGVRLFVFLRRRSGDVSSMPRRVRGTAVSWANSSDSTQSCPTPLGRPAGRPDPTRPACPGFRLDRLSRSLFDSLEGTGNACTLGELFCRRLVLPGPPRCLAVPRTDPFARKTLFARQI